MILLCLQLSGTLISGLLDLNGSTGYLNTLLGLVVIIIVVLVSMKASPLLRSLSILIGLMIGWLAHLVISREALTAGNVPFFDLPTLFSWGLPTFNPGIILTGLVVYLALLANIIASVAAMAKASRRDAGEKEFNRAVTFNGISNVLAGAGASLGTVPFSASTGLVRLSGVASKKPFIYACIFLITIGFFPQAGLIAATVPKTVGYALLIILFTQILVIGLEQIKLTSLDQRDTFVIGLSVIFGAGVASIPDASLAMLPLMARYIIGNVMVVGTLMALLLEHLVLPRSRT